MRKLFNTDNDAHKLRDFARSVQCNPLHKNHTTQLKPKPESVVFLKIEGFAIDWNVNEIKSNEFEI